MARVLQTPRGLKRVIQRVNTTWKHLHGEVDLEDLLIVTTLRESATPAYDFLVSHIDAARLKPDEGLFGPTSVTSEWKRVRKTLGIQKSVRRLVALLDITQLSEGQMQDGDKSLQGVHLPDPTDYFRRINAEQLDPEELRDQAVLGDMQTWQQESTNALVEHLADSTPDGRTYAAVWEHFALLHTRRELIQLTSRVVHFLLETDGSRATMKHPALLALWRRCNRQLSKEQNKDWLQDLILRAVPVNLQFAIDFYDYWTGDRYGIVGINRTRGDPMCTSEGHSGDCAHGLGLGAAPKS